MQEPNNGSEKISPLLTAVFVVGVSLLLWWGIISGGGRFVDFARRSAGF